MSYKSGLATRSDEWPPERVKALRRALGMTQQELAVAVGASMNTTVSRWESRNANIHKHPGPVACDRLRALEKRLGRSARSLVGPMTPTRIADLRKRLGSQAKLARAVGVEAGTVSHWENGVTKPGPEAVKRLRDVERDAFVAGNGTGA